MSEGLTAETVKQLHAHRRAKPTRTFVQDDLFPAKLCAEMRMALAPHWKTTASGWYTSMIRVMMGRNSSRYVVSSMPSFSGTFTA